MGTGIPSELFPNVYQIEDELNEIEAKEANQNLIEEVYEIKASYLNYAEPFFQCENYFIEF